MGTATIRKCCSVPGSATLLIFALVIFAGATGGCESRPRLPAAKSASIRAELGEESYRLVNRPDEIVSVLKNGSTVIVRRVPSPVVAVRAYVYTGGVFEGPRLGGGLSHLLEHLVAGGTNERRTEEQNRDLLQAIGNNSNAETHYDHTVFYVNTTSPHLDEAVDLVAGWMLGAKITPAEYRREYEVVQRELERNKGDPEDVFWELTQRNRYTLSPARVPIIGYQAVIQGLSRADVYEYYRLAYRPNNMVWSVAGDFEPQRMLGSVQKNIAEAAPGREFIRDIPPDPPVTAPRTLVATFPKLGQAKLQLGFPSVRLADTDAYALDLLGQILGGGESSILVEELRDRQQLVSSVAATNYTPYFVEGTFMIDMEVDAEQIPPATKAALSELGRIKSSPIDAQRIQRAKTQIRAERTRAQQTSESIADSLANDFMMTGDLHFADRYVDRIEAVTADDLQRVARKYLDETKLLTTALLPAESAGSKSLPGAEDLLRPAAPTTKQAQPTSEGKIARAVLPDGTILLHKRIATTPIVEIQMYSFGGVTVENTSTNGLGNLTMELVSRGTATRNAQQIAEFFDSIGGNFSADCGASSWTWSARCMRDDFERTMNVFEELVTKPSFPESELAPMKDRIAAAIEGIDADWRSQATRFFYQQYFEPSGSPFQFQPIGTKENLESFHDEDVKHWYADHVLKGHRVLAIFGDVDFNRAKVMAEKIALPAASLRAVPTTDPTVESRVEGEHRVPAIEVERVEVNSTQQPLAGVVIGFESNTFVNSTDQANAALTVADCVVSGYGYPTGYLFDTLRGRGLVYEVDAVNRPGQSPWPGTFIVIGGCDPKNVNEVIDLALENIARLQGSANDIQPEWFDRAKKLITTYDAMSTETPAEQGERAALDELYGLGYDYHQKFDERINAVTLSGIQAIARQRLSKCVITVSTPRPQLVKQATGPRTYRSFPPLELTPRGPGHD